MYIKSDYKDQYLKYIQQSHYSPITVRNLASDTNSFFTWITAYNFEIAIDRIYSQYERHLIRNGTAVHTMNRKLSSLKKFIGWVQAEYPSSLVVSRTVSSPKPINVSVLGSKSIFTKSTLALLLMGFIILTLSILYLLTMGSAQKTHTVALPLAMENADRNYLIQFDINLHSPYEASKQPNAIFMFKFYSDIDQMTSIGYVQCPYIDSMHSEGSSRLKIQIDRNCSALPYDVRDFIDRGDAVYTDIYLSGSKLTTSRVRLNNSNTVQDDSNYQNVTKDPSSQAGNPSDLLPNTENNASVLGFETVISPTSTTESVPLSMFQNVPPFQDGDIVSIYNNGLVRALLSTSIFGIKSSDHIITRGIAYIHVLNTPETPITIGDYISTSTTPGYGQRATSKYDTVVGVALEPSVPGSSLIKVLITAH